MGAAKSRTFPYEIFAETFNEIIAQDKARYSVDDLPNEFVGCWNPVFPLSNEVLTLQCSLAIMQIQKFIQSTREYCFSVFECDEDGIKVEVLNEN